MDSFLAAIDNVGEQNTQKISVIKQKYLCLSVSGDQRQNSFQVRESKTEEQPFQEHIEAPSAIAAQACEEIKETKEKSLW